MGAGVQGQAGHDHQHRVGRRSASRGGGLGVYNLTKAALIHLTRQLASELGPTRVVGIAPGLVQTDFAAFLVDNFGDKLAARLPLKRLGDPQDIANLAMFLASDLASWITGETYVIDGGAGVARADARSSVQSAVADRAAELADRGAGERVDDHERSLRRHEGRMVRP